MAGYAPTEWREGRPPGLSADELNRIEAGIVSAHERLDDLVQRLGLSTEASRATTGNVVDPGDRENAIHEIR